MPTRSDHRLVRLHVAAPLEAGAEPELDAATAHYLGSVLRLRPGATVRLFNAQDGEWEAVLLALDRKAARLRIQRLLRAAQEDPVADIWLVFAPVKRAANEWLVEKATELGVRRIVPVITQRSQTRRINQTRWQAIAREAAEQCERLSVPEIAELSDLATALAHWPGERRLYVAVERAELPHLAARLASAERKNVPLALLIGPEGGWSCEDLRVIETQDAVCPISLGPRILRAETAALFGLGLLVAHWDAGG